MRPAPATPGRQASIPFLAWWDKTAEWIVNTLLSGKFNSIFSFLFGLGFTIQLTRAADRGTQVTSLRKPVGTETTRLAQAT